MTTHGGAREGAGRPPRQEPKSRPVWCGQMSEDDRALILERLTPQERYQALMRGILMKERRERHRLQMSTRCDDPWSRPVNDLRHQL